MSEKKVRDAVDLLELLDRKVKSGRIQIAEDFLDDEEEYEDWEDDWEDDF